MTDAELSLRERKKERTRRALIDASTRLFGSQGYEATTLEQICDEVELSVPTLLAYFPSKDRLAMATSWELHETLQREILDPERTEKTLTIWRRYVETGARRVAANPQPNLRVLSLSRESAQLRKAVMEFVSAVEDTLAAGFAVDFATDADRDLPTRLLATILAWGNQRVIESWIDAGGEGDFVADCLAVVDFAIERFPRPGTNFERWRDGR